LDISKTVAVLVTKEQYTVTSLKRGMSLRRGTSLRRTIYCRVEENSQLQSLK